MLSPVVKGKVSLVGLFDAPASWVTVEPMWHCAYDRFVMQLSVQERDLVVTLADEWDGTVGEIISAAKTLAAKPEATAL